MRRQPLRYLADRFDAWFEALPSKKHTRFAYYLKQRIDLLWLLLNDCTCGSGGHPRRCRRHPWAFDQHRADIDHGGLYDQVQELEERLERIEKQSSDSTKRMGGE